MVNKKEFEKMRENREGISDKKMTEKIMRIIAKENNANNFPSTREISNVFHGQAKDSVKLKTEIQDSILQSILNPLRKRKILVGRYGKRNQLYWELNKVDLKRLSK